MQLTFWERVTLLFTGKLWCGLLTFGKPLQPSRFSVRKRDIIPKPDHVSWDQLRRRKTFKEENRK